MTIEPNNFNAASFEAEVDDVFARIASKYDRLCDIFSLMIHRSWKANMARSMQSEGGGVVLDVASGTGDIPLRYLRQPESDNVDLTVTDISPQMLALAKQKIGTNINNVSFQLMNAEDLVDVPDASVDVYSISFAMKIIDRKRALREAIRVLKPGGVFYCLEASRIPVKAIHNMYLAYMDWCMPVIGRLATNGDASAYQYLLKGVHDFPGSEAFAAEIMDHGFADVSFKRFTFGIAALHRAVKPRID